MALRTVLNPRGAAALLDFQMWCWGQDVHHPAGNQLLAGGLVRTRPPLGAHGSTLYTAPLPGDRILCLWGFAVGVRTADGPCLLLKRHGFTVRVVPADELRHPFWQPSSLPKGRLARGSEWAEVAAAHFVAMTEWIAAYEEGVCRRVGSTWRHECAARRPREQRHRLPVQPDTLSQAWLVLRDDMRAQLTVPAT